MGLGAVACLRVFSCLDLACLDSSAWKSGQEGIVPVLHSNLCNVIKQVKGLLELVHGNVDEPVAGKKECVFCVAERVRE